jgi:hypothetical protein
LKIEQRSSILNLQAQHFLFLIAKIIQPDAGQSPSKPAQKRRGKFENERGFSLKEKDGGKE